MQVDTDSIFSAIEEAWRDAPQGANTFYEQLDKALAEKTSFNRGGSVVSLTRNGSSHSNAGPSGQTETPKQTEAVRSKCKSLYRIVARNLSLTIGAIDDAGELQIYNEIVELYDAGFLAAVLANAAKENFPDFSEMRCGPVPQEAAA